MVAAPGPEGGRGRSPRGAAGGRGPRRDGGECVEGGGRRGRPQVADGDTLVILESMKMEIPVLAEDSGTLTRLHVAEGDVVQEGDLIAIIS